MDVEQYILKYAVNLKQLTKGYNALVKPRRVKKSSVMGLDLASANKAMDLPKKTHAFGLNFDGTKASIALTKKSKLVDPKSLPNISYMSRKSIAKSKFKKGSIHMRGDIGSGIAKSKHFSEALGPKITQLKHPKSKEIVGKTFGLHEAAELATHTPGKITGQYLGHNGAKPFLNDLTIANTLTGKGSAQAKGFIRRVRKPEIQGLEAGFPHLKRLNMGKKRLNRREKRHIAEKFQHSEKDVLKAWKDNS